MSTLKKQLKKRPKKSTDINTSSTEYGEVRNPENPMETSQYNMTKPMRRAFDDPVKTLLFIKKEEDEEKAYYKTHPDEKVDYNTVYDKDGLAKELKEFNEERGIVETKADIPATSKVVIPPSDIFLAEKRRQAAIEAAAAARKKQEEKEKRKRATELALNKADARATAAALKEGRTTATELRETAQLRERAANKEIGGKRTRHTRKRSRRTTKKNKRVTRRGGTCRKGTRRIGTRRIGTHRKR